MARKAIVGHKVGMTQVWNDDNRIVPVTVLEVTPARVVQVKTNESDGYSAIQVTVGSKKAEKLTRPEAGHFAKAGVDPGSELIELRLDDVSDYEVGQEIGVDTFADGEAVDAIGTSKGRGFTGVMKRHNFSGQRATHGAHLVHRMPGSVGQCATPARVFKGTRMAGRSGSARVTVQSLTVVSSDTEKNLMLVKGSVPGPKGSTVIIRNAIKKASATDE